MDKKNILKDLSSLSDLPDKTFDFDVYSDEEIWERCYVFYLEGYNSNFKIVLYNSSKNFYENQCDIIIYYNGNYHVITSKNIDTMDNEIYFPLKFALNMEMSKNSETKQLIFKQIPKDQQVLYKDIVSAIREIYNYKNTQL